MIPRRPLPLVRALRVGSNRARIFRKLVGRAMALCVAPCLALAALLLPTESHAQHFSFRKYTQAEGLTNLAVGYLVQGRDADMWIGTDSGLFRFDGSGFMAYDRSQGLLKEAVRGVAEDPYGRMWVSLDRGLYHGSKSQFRPVATADGPVVPDPGMPLVFLGPDRVLTSMRRQIIDLRSTRSTRGTSNTENGDAIEWRATSLFTPGQLRADPGLGDVRSMVVAPGGTVWLGCGHALCSLSTRGVHRYGPDDGVPEADWTTLLPDRDGRVWARSASRLVVLEAGAAAFVSRDPPNAALKSGLTSPVLAMDAQGRVLTRTAFGLARWNGREWAEFTPANGLPGTVITGIHTDADGDLWLSVFGQGVWHWLGYGHIESWSRAEGMQSDSVWAIVRDAEGRLVFGTDHECEWLDESTKRIRSCPFKGLPMMQALTLSLDSSGGLWFGFGMGAVWTVPQGSKDAVSIGSVGLRGTVAQIAFDDPKRVWIGGNANGLHYLDPVTRHLTTVPLPGDPSRVWESVALRGSTTRAERCVATSQGLYRVALDSDDPAAMDSNDRVAVGPSPTAERIEIRHEGADAGFLSMAQQFDGSVWVTSTSQGILHTRGCTAEGAEWVSADIVATAHAYVIRIDHRGWVWAGTDQGVVVFDGTVWQRLDASDGLVWNDTNENAFWADNDGSVWIGTSAGMTHVIDPEGLFARRRKPLDLRIASASLGDAAFDLEAGSRGQQQVRWEADASFDLRLASHSHGRSTHTRFEYRLLGMSPKWLGSRLAEVHLPALEPGAYRFEARAIDPDHAQHSNIVAMEFEVVPPWWRSTLFRGLLALLAFLLLVVAWRAQIARLHARRRALEAQYRDREALLDRATRDGLTGLWNRSTIIEILAREIAQWQRTGVPLAVALLDVDHFKRINDTLGHLAGDDVLRDLGTRVGEALRQSDWIGRYGGEELLVVMPGLLHDEAAAPVERLRECVAERLFESQGRHIEVTLSIGLAWCMPGIDRVEDLIAQADGALYEAKRTGRNRVVHATPATSRDREMAGTSTIG